MPPELIPPQDDTQNLWNQLQSSITDTDGGYQSVLMLGLYLAIGGALAMYIRFLYRVTARPTSSQSIARIFPLLTLVTVAVIAVVKASLALSLGLVGALSIVRFRSAVKDPEELVYLFLCIGVGLALGAEQPLIAGILVVVATLFALVFDRLGPGGNRSDAYLTVVGDAARYFGAEEHSALDIVRTICPKLTVQRCDVEGDQGQLRVQLHRIDTRSISTTIAELRTKLPECEISYANAEAMI